MSAGGEYAAYFIFKYRESGLFTPHLDAENVDNTLSSGVRCVFESHASHLDTCASRPSITQAHLKLAFVDFL